MSAAGSPPVGPGRGGQVHPEARSIDVRRLADSVFAVTVLDGDQRSSHRVSVPAALAGELGHPDQERLVRVTFEFLLEREPATSILGEFPLDVVGRYFPEYLLVIRARLAG